MLRLCIVALLVSSCFQQPKVASVERKTPVEDTTETPSTPQENTENATRKITGEDFFQDKVLEAFGI